MNFSKNIFSVLSINMSFERVHPPQVNYDNVLPLAVESRSNRREFHPVNGQSFSNSNGATIIRIDVNADSMLDASHSYLECDISNDNANTTYMGLNPFSPAFIQRLRIESGGVVIEDINEYSRLYAMLSLNQCPESYIKNNQSNQGLYKPVTSGMLMAGGAVDGDSGDGVLGGAAHVIQGTTSTDACSVAGTQSNLDTELYYPMTAQAVLSGVNSESTDDTTPTGVAGENQPTADGLAGPHARHKVRGGASTKLCFPLVSGWLNMDKYIPLIMMNAGFTIELTLCDANRIGTCYTEAAGDDTAIGDAVDCAWSVTGCKYVSHLIDLDREFYDKLRLVMDDAGGTLQLAGQTYRHFTGNLPAGTGPHTITLPARVKSVKSIFGTFIDSTQVGANSNYDTSVFQQAKISKYRFEIGSVRYPQTDVAASTRENEVELQKAWGKLGDYSHQTAYSFKHTFNTETARTGLSVAAATLSAAFIGYDFEAFQRVALESGINTADRSLPINFICEKSAETDAPTRADFYVLTDAIFYINMDGTASVSV